MRAKELQGSQEFFDPDKLKEIINQVKGGKLSIRSCVTRTGGLNKKWRNF